MKVIELINKLEKLSPEATIIILDLEDNETTDFVILDYKTQVHIVAELGYEKSDD